MASDLKPWNLSEEEYSECFDLREELTAQGDPYATVKVVEHFLEKRLRRTREPEREPDGERWEVEDEGGGWRRYLEGEEHAREVAASGRPWTGRYRRVAIIEVYGTPIPVQPQEADDG